MLGDVWLRTGLLLCNSMSTLDRLITLLAVVDAPGRPRYSYYLPPKMGVDIRQRVQAFIANDG